EVYGGVLVGTGVSIIYLLMRRLPIRLYCDIAAPSLLFGMGVGRIGCYLVGCCWGAQCSPNLPWAVRFPPLSSPQVQQWSDRVVTLPATLLIIDPNGLAMPFPHQMLKWTEADLDRLRARSQALDTDILKARD